MPPHEQFELMSALAAAGELDPSERHVLDRHLTECRNCRDDVEDFREIVAQMASQPPPPEATADPQVQMSRFQNFAADHGLAFSRGARRAFRKRTLILRPYSLAYAAATIFFVASLATGAILVRHRRSANLKSPVSSARIAPTAFEAQNTLADRERLVELQNELRSSQSKAEQIPSFEKELTEATRERARLQDVIQDRDRDISLLKVNLANVQQQFGVTQAFLVTATRRNDDIAAELLSDRATIAGLTNELHELRSAAEQERQLFAASRDVRELMGARHLYMIDVYDGEDTSRAKRSFGRVFYTEGKSLIFYAFDLDQNKGSKRVTFAAWGERGKDPGTVRQLGVFQIDDAAQKRWVMKVDDPQKLQSIDAIFVTVETAPGMNRPAGQKLLYAYLGGQPNHP